jgi:hypothetical protein
MPVIKHVFISLLIHLCLIKCIDELIWVYAMKAYRGSRGIPPFILILGTRSYVVNFTPRLLYPWKEPRYPLYRRVGGPQRRSGRCGEEGN